MRFQNERGFTLIESLLHCLLFSVSAFGLAILLTVVYHIPTTADVLHEVEWEVASFDVNHLLLNNVENIRRKSSDTLLVTLPKEPIHELQNTKNEFELVLQEPYLVKRKKDGFEPILTTVEGVKDWSIEGDRILMNAKLRGRAMRERVFYAPNLTQ
ncbi:MAG: hypothetical protein ABS882_04650 [Lysinibacillus sp.]